MPVHILSECLAECTSRLRRPPETRHDCGPNDAYDDCYSSMVSNVDHIDVLPPKIVTCICGQTHAIVSDGEDIPI